KAQGIRVWHNVISGEKFDTFHKVTLGTVKDVMETLATRKPEEQVQITYRPEQASERTQDGRTWVSYAGTLGFYLPKK
ncbi:hypothetical protein LCGC14_2016990, partial [marine sediment metagenome]